MLCCNAMASSGILSAIMLEHPTSPIVQVLLDPESLALTAAEFIVQAAQSAIHDQGRFSLALAGGNTPRLAYRRLASPDFAGRLDWKNIHIFWGDERCVAMDSPDSNFRMAKEALLDRVPIPAENIHAAHADLEPDSAARQYEMELRAFFGSFGAQDDRLTTFDLILLGLGDDGHTASLFPGSPALSETGRRVMHVEHSQPPPPLVPRLTLTLPAINAAERAAFLVSGGSKAKILANVFSHPDKRLPAQLIRLDHGQIFWLVDQDAAASLP